MVSFSIKTTVLFIMLSILPFTPTTSGEEWNTIISPNKATLNQNSSATTIENLDVAKIYEKANPAVVTIVIKAENKDGQVGHGSGFFVAPNGYILTNNHVAELAKTYAGLIYLEVITLNEQRLKARIITTDPEMDIALLKVDGSGYPYLETDNIEDVKVGNEILIIGTPTRLEFRNSLTTGVISGFNRLKGWIQTSAITHGGNSGGPAINKKNGKVIGILVAGARGHVKKIIQTDKGGIEIIMLEDKPGISYLIPINHAKNLLNLTK